MEIDCQSFQGVHTFSLLENSQVFSQNVLDVFEITCFPFI